MDAFDPRIVQVGVEFDGKTTTFEGLNIMAIGRKYGTAIMNECDVRIFNLSNQERHDILTMASPIKQKLTPIKLTLDVGRESYGAFRLYEGQVIACGSTQPPDIGISLKSLTGNYFMSLVNGYSQPPISSLKNIAQLVATANGLKLDFQATDKQIENYSFSGAAAKQIEKLNQMGNIIAFQDNDKLIVVDAGGSLQSQTRLINSQTGMVGIPEITQKGIRVKMMIDNSIRLFGKVQVESEINPAANGLYQIIQLNFEIANRENPFWYILECLSPAYWIGGTQ